MDSTALLPIGKLPFANQLSLTNELTGLLNSRGQNKIRGILYRTPSGSGFTRFLEHNIEKKSEDSIRVYIDASSNEEDIILVEFFHELKAFYSSPTRKTKQHIRERAQDIIDIAVSTYSDFEGPGSKTLSKLGDMIGGNIRSRSFESFRNVIDKLPDDISVVFMIDNVHENPAIIKDFIKKTMSEYYDQVFYVMGYGEPNSEEYEVFLNEIFDYGVNIINKDFPSPDENLVEEILLMANKHAPKLSLTKLLKECNYNLHKIISKLRKRVNNSDENLSEISKSILLYLHCSRQSLDRDTIKKLVMLDPAIYIDEDPHWFERSLEEISEYTHVNGESLLQLVAPLPFNVSNPNRIRHVENLYNDSKQKFVSKNTSPKLLSILFQLSMEVDTSSTTLYSQEILRHALYSGSLETARKHYKICKREYCESDWDNYFLNLCFLISSKKYSESLDLIESEIPESFSENILTLVLKAVALNRVRKHDESIKLIKLLLINESISLEQRALLISFYIGGLIHTNQMDDAYRIYEKNHQLLGAAKNYGYFIRNSAGACQLNEAIDLSKKAIEIFKIHGDDYGLNTSRSNLGAYLSMKGRHSESFALFKESKSYLDSIGLIHLEEIYVNWGLAQLYSGKIEESEVVIKKAIRFSSENVPKYYALQILSLLCALQEKFDESFFFLDEGYQIALKIDVKEHRNRYLANAALISGFCAPRKKTSEGYREKAENNLYSYGKEKVLAILNLLKQGNITRDELVTYFIPPFMFYWSQEPIFVLDIGSSL